MKRNLLLTTATVFMLGAGVAMAQSSTGTPSAQSGATQSGATQSHQQKSDGQHSGSQHSGGQSATQGAMQAQQQNPSAAPNAVGDKSAMGANVSLDQMMGKDVYGADGSKIGSIGDIILDPQSGRAQLAVVERGGLLGIGGKSIGIDYTLLGMEGDRLVAKQVTEAQAKDMPEFTYQDNAVSYNKDRNKNADRNQNPNREDPNARPATQPKQ